MTFDTRAVVDPKAKYWWNIATFAQVGGPHRNIVMAYGTKKLEWCGHPLVNKNWEICQLVSTEYTKVTDRRTDGRTDGQTPLDGVDRAYA